MAYDIVIVSAAKYAPMAKALAEKMQHYRLPDKVTPQSSLNYKSILLDTEETSLDEAGKQALIDAGYMIVLFSPEVRASADLQARLDFYEKQCGRETIVPVIADGEPADIFPDMFIQHRVVQRILADGSIVNRTETIEPVAADLRAVTPKRRKELLEYETTRIVATVLDLHPDDLERRAARRRKRRILTVVSIVGTLLLAATILFAVLGIRAKREGDLAALQTEQTAKAVRRLTEELPETFPEEAAQELIEQSVTSAKQALEAAGLGEYLTEKGE